MPILPNIWKTEPKADRLYGLYLCRLQQHNLHQETVEACRIIRRYAKRSVGVQSALFTFYAEIDSLEQLGDYRRAWNVLREWDVALHGRRRDLQRTRWTPDDTFQLTYFYAPLLYLLRRYDLGRRLLERSFHLSLGKAGRWGSYSVLHSVYKPPNDPAKRHDLSLTHFYERLGRSIIEWHGWRKWVAGLHPRLLSITGVKRSDLLTDPSLLRMFCSELRRIHDERCPFPVTRGQRDFIEPAATVRRWNKRQERSFSRFMNGDVSSTYDKRVTELFPGVASLHANG